MDNLNNVRNKKRIVEKFFKWVFDRENVELEQEVDITLVADYYDPNIYYPKEIAAFFKTDAMQRLGRIGQLGLMVLEGNNFYNNRLEHSKGVYNRKLEELIYLSASKDFRKYIEENNLKMYLVAELIKLAAHDIGHLPLSHIMEVKVLGRRGAHEDLGRRVLLEDEQISQVLDSICPNFKEILKEQINEDVLSLDSHDDGNYDVDRLDYLYRDALYSGVKIKDYDHERFYRKYAKLDENGKLARNSDGSIIIADDNCEEKVMVDIYKARSLKEIEKLLELRVQNYQNMYFSANTQVSDSLVGEFLKYMLEDDSCQEGNELKEYTKKLIDQKENIDIKEFLAWDDIRFFKNCIEFAENTSNKNIREFAAMIIPNIYALMNLTYSHLDLKNAREEKYQNLSNEHKNFIKKIKEIILSKDDLSMMIKDKKYYSRNCLISTNQDVIDKLQEKYGESLSYTEATVYGYKTKTPIYVEDEQGHIFELHKHPQRCCDWDERKETTKIVYSAIPELKLKGFSDDQIANIVKDFKAPEQSKNNQARANEKNDISMRIVKVDSNMEDYFDI